MGWKQEILVIMKITKKLGTVIMLPKNELSDADALGFTVFDELLKSVSDDLREGRSVLLIPTDD